MQRLLLFTLLTLLSSFLIAQNVPNRGFEAWETHYMPVSFEDWTTSNQMFTQNGLDTFNVSPSSDAAFGNHSAYLQTIQFMGDTVPAYIISGGYIEGDSSGLVGIGGIPFTAQPDSLIYWAKHDILSGDTGLVAVLFKTGGVQTKMVMGSITGSQNTWKRYALEMGSYTSAPDTVLVAFVSTNPDRPNVNGWLMIDGVSFAGTSQNVNNPGLEILDTVSFTNPEGWVSTNNYSAAFGAPEAVQISTDAHSGQYAMRIEPVYFDAFQGKWGYALTGSSPNDFAGGFPYNHQPTKLSGWYKYSTLSTDTAMVLLMISRYDTIGDSTIQLAGSGTALIPTNTYTYFEFPISFNQNEIVDTAFIAVTPSKAMFGGSQDSVKLGSVLLLDDLWLHGACDWTDTTELFVSDTLSGCSPYLVDAGGGFDSYLWSTGATTQSVSIDSSGLYSLTVMDTATCSLTEDVYIVAVICPGFAEETFIKPLTVFPNPSSGSVFVRQENQTEPLTLQLHSAEGRLLKEYTLNTGETAEIDLSQMANGMYLLRTSGKEHRSEHFLIKQ